MSSVTLIDFNGLWWRCWHANGDSPISEAVAQTMRLIEARAAEADHIAVCVDSHPTWRHKLYAGYKAQREKHDEQALEQLRRCLAAVEERGWPIVRRDGQEADDVMGSLAVQLESDHDVCIYSADKDMLQCLTPRVSRLSPAQPGAGAIGPDELLAKYAITPAQVPVWLALIGDRSDNILGVHRCGAKTATKLLADHGDVAGILRAAYDGQLSPALNKAVVEAAERADCPLSVALKLARLDLQAASAGDVERVLAEVTPPPMDDDDDAEAIEAPAAEPTIPSAPPSAVDAELVDTDPAPPAAPSSRAITRPADWESGLEPSSINEAKQLAKYAYDSRLFGAYGTPQAALMTIIAGRELGIPAMASLRAFHIIEGKPCLSAQAMMAIALQHSAVAQFEVIESTDECCTVRVHRNGWQQPHDVSWTIADAERAGCNGKKNWRRYPRQMLRARAIADAARLVCPERLASMYDPEEIQQ